MPGWLMITIIVSICILLALGAVFAWSKWMTRPGNPEDNAED